MGVIEKNFKKRNKRYNIKKAILESVSAIGLIGVSLVAPGVIKHLKHLGFDPKNRQKEIINTSRNNLVRKGLLMYEGKFLKLTPKGEKELMLFDMKDWEKSKPKKWDGKWRVLIFDIPEKRKNLREKVRTTLLSIGFKRLQDSVWLYPYDCEDFINLVKVDFKIGKDLLYLIADSIENDKNYKKIFNL